MGRLPLQTKLCPFCAEKIQAAAVKCRFCGEFLTADKPVTPQFSQPAAPQPAEDRKRPDMILFEGSPSVWGIAGALVKGAFCFLVACFLIFYPLENRLLAERGEEVILMAGRYRVILGLLLAVVVLLILEVKIRKLKSIHYEVTPDRIEWARGIFARKVDNLDMFRIVDLKLRRSFLDRIFGIGTVELMTTDKTDSLFVFEKMHDSQKLYDAIKKSSLEADRKRGVVHLE
jgi:membrane protein YdbS with pleckstrin-like domain